MSCQRQSITPKKSVVNQIKVTELRSTNSISGEHVNYAHMDCLEEIFQRVRFDIIDFSKCSIDDDTLIALSDMIEFYDLAVCLNLSYNQNISLRGWQTLFRMLRKTPCVQTLNLNSTSLSDRAVPMLSKVLRADAYLQCLYLEHCSISGKSLLLLANGLKSNASIRELYLSDNNICSTDITYISQMLSSNSTLEVLDLKNNQIQDSGLPALCNTLTDTAVQGKTKLHTLILWNNRLTASGMVHISNLLFENKVLRTLNLGANEIRTEGAMILKDALIRNRTLLKIGLQNTKLNCQAAITIAECLAENPVLIRVDLRDNPGIKSAGLLALHVALKINTTVLSVNLDKTCCEMSSMSRGKQFADHLKKTYREFEAFVYRNNKLILDRMRSEKLAVVLSSPPLVEIPVTDEVHMRVCDNGVVASQPDTGEMPVVETTMPAASRKAEASFLQRSSSVSAGSSAVVSKPVDTSSRAFSTACRSSWVSAQHQQSRDGELEAAVKQVVKDLVNFCTYDVDGVAFLRSTSVDKLVPTAGRNSVDGEIRDLIEDLVRFCEFETRQLSHDEVINPQQKSKNFSSLVTPVVDDENVKGVHQVAQELINGILKRVAFRLDKVRNNSSVVYYL
ncbi:unnamed protein product [Soboliphyme baturini]|uniref:Protein phosphatase 1 regulatory subunit 37 n=1 Tax=Soboliphyme baturini TaxID=241478 RepID=A0A183IKC9_9BILA|nr:unnamed protein product [Soboliphyme baturini]